MVVSSRQSALAGISTYTPKRSIGIYLNYITIPFARCHFLFLGNKFSNSLLLHFDRQRLSIAFPTVTRRNTGMIHSCEDIFGMSARAYVCTYRRTYERTRLWIRYVPYLGPYFDDGDGTNAPHLILTARSFAVVHLIRSRSVCANGTIPFGTKLLTESD